jgi:hypothetical protein
MSSMKQTRNGLLWLIVTDSAELLFGTDIELYEIWDNRQSRIMDSNHLYAALEWSDIGILVSKQESKTN